MTTLERRCRLLLRAYPAGYRQERGEEIIGTLLEGTPQGRSWPLARDVRSLVMGGLQARAALNRQLTTAANLRVATLIGVSAFLALMAVNNLHLAVLQLTASPGQAHHLLQAQALHRIQAQLARHGDWLLMAGVLVWVAVAVAWVSSRRTVVLAAAMAAVGALVLLHHNQPPGASLPVTEVVCLTALALVADGHERPGRRWLWPAALVTAWPLAAILVPGFWFSHFLVLAVALGILSLLWGVADARPALAMAVFALAFWLRPGVASNLAGPGFPAALPPLIVSVLAPVLVWQLHRQSARPTTRHES